MPTCISCEKKDSFTTIEKFKGQFNYLLKLIKCNSCGLIFLENPPSGEIKDKMFSGDPYGKKIKSDEEEIKNRLGILKYAEKYAKRNSGKLLDAGCAKGYLVAAAKQKNWNSFGIDFRKKYADYGNNVLDVKIYQRELLEVLENLDHKFDIIILWHTLEHVPYPKKLIEKLKEKLSPDGIITIQVPDYEKLKKSIVGIHHISYFSPDSLKNLTKICDLELLSYDYDSKNGFIGLIVRKQHFN